MVIFSHRWCHYRIDSSLQKVDHLYVHYILYILSLCELKTSMRVIPTFVPLWQAVDAPDDVVVDVFVLGHARRHLYQTGRQHALRHHSQPLQPLDLSRLPRRRMPRSVAEPLLDAEHVDPRLRYREANLDILARRLDRPPTVAMVTGDEYLGAHLDVPVDDRHGAGDL